MSTANAIALQVVSGTDPETELVVRVDAPESEALSCWSSPVLIVERASLIEPLDRRLVLLEDPSSPGARSYRLLRHRLLTTGDPRVIAVTSALPGEGKTTAAVNLALSIAEESVGNVLFLDANPRRPALAGLFGLGTLGACRSANPGQDAYYTTAAIGSTRLHVASALGGDTAHASRLDRADFGQLLGDLRGVYDYIVTDAASVLDSADADVVSELADGVVVAVRSRTSRRSIVSRAIEELHPAHVLGVVLLDV